MKNYYKILEINEYASQEVIKAAYKALAKKYHPDNCGKDMQKKRMTEINEAYQVLSDPERKVKYDNCLKAYIRDATEQDHVGNKNNDVKEEKTHRDKKGFFARLFEEIGKSIVSDMQKVQKQYEECYLEGLGLDNRRLVFKYRQAKGYERLGYARALEDRGFLEKDKDGRYKPTYAMREYL